MSYCFFSEICCIWSDWYYISVNLSWIEHLTKVLNLKTILSEVKVLNLSFNVFFLKLMYELPIVNWINTAMKINTHTLSIFDFWVICMGILHSSLKQIIIWITPYFGEDLHIYSVYMLSDMLNKISLTVLFLYLSEHLNNCRNIVLLSNQKLPILSFLYRIYL